MKWMLIACYMAAPIAYFFDETMVAELCIQNTKNWWIFALSGLLTIAIAALAINWQSWRAARQNPVNSLRDE